jgi:lactate dehydrogenase-like 2-hydroxyacid dehydrogenase
LQITPGAASPEAKLPIEILSLHKQLPIVEKNLPELYTTHELHSAPDPVALIKSVGPRIRAAVGGAMDAVMMDKLPKLEIIANPGVGYDGIDVEAAAERGIRVSNTPDVLNDAMGELTIGLMVALARAIPEADQYVRAGKWPAANFRFTTELTGKTVGIVGLGRIGKEIAVRCQAMKMRIVYHGRHRQPDQPHIFYDDLGEMARDSDWLIVIAPGGATTKGIISRQVLEALGPKGFLVNMARGSLVDEPALVDILQAGGIRGAALDVFEDQPNVPAALLGLSNVVLSPHQGSATEKTRTAMGQLVLDNLAAHFACKLPLTPVV